MTLNTVKVIKVEPIFINFVANSGPKLAPTNKMNALKSTALPLCVSALALITVIFVGTINDIHATKTRLKNMTNIGLPPNPIKKRDAAAIIKLVRKAQ